MSREPSDPENYQTSTSPGPRSLARVNLSLTAVAGPISDENVASVGARVIRRLFLCVSWEFTGVYVDRVPRPMRERNQS
jgi:hypothetical protein